MLIDRVLYLRSGLSDEAGATGPASFSYKYRIQIQAQNLGTQFRFIRVFPKWSRTVIEFSDFSELRESDTSLKHELGSVSLACVLLPLW